MAVRYIGSKARVAEAILDLIGEPQPDSVFADLFAGTGAVLEAAADRGWSIRLNDHLFSAVVMSRARLVSSEEAPFSELGGYEAAAESMARGALVPFQPVVGRPVPNEAVAQRLTHVETRGWLEQEVGRQLRCPSRLVAAQDSRGPGWRDGGPLQARFTVGHPGTADVTAASVSYGRASAQCALLGCSPETTFTEPPRVHSDRRSRLMALTRAGRNG